MGYRPKGGEELDTNERLSSKRAISYEKKQNQCLPGITLVFLIQI